MDLNSIVVADFKTLFRRDFPYLPVFDITKRYNAGTTVYDQTNDLFYSCLENGTTGAALTDATKWSPSPDDSADNYVADSDISRAFLESQALLNQGLLGKDETIRLGYLYLTAHFLCLDLRTALAGFSATGGGFMLGARSVGNVSESYTVPDRYADDPIVAQYAQTGYGTKYLSLILPNLVGNIGVVGGATVP